MLTTTLPDHESVELMRAAATLECSPYLLADEKKPGRLARAIEAVRDGLVQQEEDKRWTVQSQTHPEQRYFVGSRCTCPESPHRNNRWCKHAIAVELYSRWRSALGEGPSTRPLKEEASAPQPRMTNGVPRPEREALPAPAGGGPTAVSAPATPRPLAEIIADLSRSLPDACVSELPARGSGEVVRYLHWWIVADLLDAYAPGWEGRIISVKNDADGCTLVYRLTIPCAEGMCARETTAWEPQVQGFGNSVVNAEATALCRAARLFGVRWLYGEKDGTRLALREHLQGVRG